MAKKKATTTTVETPVVETVVVEEVKKEQLVVIDQHNGYFKLIASLGVRDTRTGKVYSEVICKEQEIHFYEAVQE